MVRIRAELKQNFLQRFISKLSADPKEKRSAQTGWSKASSDSSEIAFADRTKFQKASGKRELEVLYRNSWAVKKAINVRANLLSFRGLKFQTESDKERKVLKDFLIRMHPTRPLSALSVSFRDRSINADIFGNHFDELMYNSKKVAGATKLLGTSIVHPINIDFIRDSSMGGGEEIKFKPKTKIPEGWRWQHDPQQDNYGGIELELDRVAYLKYNNVGDELLGMSSIEPVYKTAERLMKIEEGVTQGILTHGNPLHDVIVGDETHPPTKKMIDNVSEEVAGLNTKSEYVHPPWIRVGQIESFSLGKSPNYMQPYITAIGAAFEVPEFILTGRGEGTNKATAQAMLNFIHQTIQPLQNMQAMYYEEKILGPLMRLEEIEHVPTIEWNEILPKNPNDYAQIIKVVSEAMVGGKQIATIEELREMAGLGKNVAFKPVAGGASLQKALPGLFLVEPHGKMIWTGEKKLIVKAKDFSNMADKPLFLVSDKKIYGKITLRKPAKISLENFDDLQNEHMITDKERLKWWPKAESLFSYRFSFDKFEKPKDFSPPQGVQTFIKEVSLP